MMPRFLFTSIITFMTSLVALQVNGQQAVSDSQQYYVIGKLPFSSEVGIVFKKEYQLSYRDYRDLGRFTPTSETVDSVERIFAREFPKTNDIPPAVFRKMNINRAVRQYVGYIDSSGHRMVLLQVIENSRPGKTRKFFGKDWQKNFVGLMTEANFYGIWTILAVDLNEGVLKPW